MTMSDDMDSRWERLMLRMDRMIQNGSPSNAPAKDWNDSCTRTENGGKEGNFDDAPVAGERDACLPSIGEVDTANGFQFQGSQQYTIGRQHEPVRITEGITDLNPVFTIAETVVLQEESSHQDLGGRLTPNSFRSVGVHNPSQRQTVSSIPRNGRSTGAESDKDSWKTESSTEKSSDSGSDPTWHPDLQSSSSDLSSYCSTLSDSGSDSVSGSLLKYRTRSGQVGNHQRFRTTKGRYDVARGRRVTIGTSNRHGGRTGIQVNTKDAKTSGLRDLGSSWHPDVQQEQLASNINPLRKEVISNSAANRNLRIVPPLTVARGAEKVEKGDRGQKDRRLQGIRIQENWGSVIQGTGKQQQTVIAKASSQVLPTMVKGKETFEDWSLPRSRVKPSTRANPEEEERNEGVNARGKGKVIEQGTVQREGKGMKKTAVSVRVDVNSMEGNDVPRPVHARLHNNAEQVTGVFKSPRRGGENFSVDEENVLEPTRGKRALVVSTAAPVFDDSDGGQSSPEQPRTRHEKGSPSSRKGMRPDKSKRTAVSPQRAPGKRSGRLSPEGRNGKRFTHNQRLRRELSYTDTGSEEGLEVGSYDTSRSRSPDRNRKGKRPEREHRRRRSYSLSEEEAYRDSRDMERRTSRHLGGGGSRRYEGEKGDSSMLRRRHWSPRPDSEDGGRGAHIRQERRRHSSSEEDLRRGRSESALAMQSNVVSRDDENAKRKERRHKQKERESRRTQRENQGLKGHYISVDEHGEPYGYGKGAWKQELASLCRSLDPSVMDIRWQPEADMKLLRRRLKDNFEYSAPISRAYIRSLAGRNVTQRRNKILNSMVENAPCPSGMNANVWRRLDRIRHNPRREELCQRMRYANSCRTNVGRTGPKGVSGVRDDLRDKLGREPDPEELEEELRRDKGYGGRSKKKRTAMKDVSSNSDGEDKNPTSVENEGGGDGTRRQMLWDQEDNEVTAADVVSAEKEYIRSLEKQIAELTAKKQVMQKAGDSTCIDGGGPSVQQQMRMEEMEVNDGSPAANLTAGDQESGEIEGNGRASEVPQVASAAKRRKSSRR